MLNRRERRTLAAVTRTLVPAGTIVPHSADDLGLVDTVIAEVDGYPRRAHRRMRWLFLATEYMPFATGYARPFSRLSPQQQHEVLEKCGRHKRSPLRRLVVSFLKQLVYGAYISEAPIEGAVGYRYECAVPVEGREGDRVHH